MGEGTTSWQEKYQEVDLDVVMKYFSNDFDVPDGKVLIGTTYWIDATKKKVMYRLIWGDKND